MTEQTAMKVRVGPPDEQGKRNVRVLHGDEVIYADTVDIVSLQNRGAFVCAVVERCPGIRAEALEDAIRQALSSPPSKQGKSARAPERTPFPLSVLPDDVAEYCRVVAEARSVDVSVPALAALVATASAVGGSRVAYDDYAVWREPCILWGAIVIRSGGRKSPVIDDMFGPIFELQAVESRRYKRAFAEYEKELQAWEDERRKKKGEVGDRPEKPTKVDLYTSDATPEAMARLLAVNPRGVASILDELSGFFGRMGKYGSAGPLADFAFWLSLFRAQSAKIDRASKEPIYVERGVGSILGGIQPKILGDCFDGATVSSGMASRFLLVAPPPQTKRYGRGPSRQQRERYTRLIEGLYALEFESFADEDGEPAERPVEVLLEDSCRELLAQFVPDWSEESMTEAESVEAAMSKLEGYAIRFALVLRCIREAQGLASSNDRITRDDLERGIQLARWFKGEAVAIYSELTADNGDQQARVLEARVSAIRSMGGAVTKNEWYKKNKRRSREQADAELEELVGANLAHWRERAAGGGGGRPTTECAVGPDPGGVMGCSPPQKDPEPVPLDRIDADPGGGEVMGIGYQGAGASSAMNGLLDPRKGGEESGEIPESVNLHPKTPSDGAASEPVIDTPDRDVEPCSPIPETLNLRDEILAAYSSEPGTSPHGMEAIGDEQVEAIPWNELVGSTSATPSCFNCESTSFWRRRVTSTGRPGHWTCARCSAPTIAEGLIERQDFQGGAA